ncbi:tape measure protein [Clostridium sp.]|uniref:tape measure protein n=1 Tax=Clostridium sp. TaxID=1506 RepID=UPI0025B8151C|nr:tape measure protein [Clostridium sp.]
MATLKAMFRLFDGYSTTVDKIVRKTDQATNKILGASGATDKFNDKLKKAGAGSSFFSSGLGKIVGVAATATTALKSMSITDEFVNTNARIALINDGLQTQAELQEKIFKSASRAKGAYTDMAGAITRMGLLAGESFGSNDELIAFTELVQKSFKVGGASQSEQSAAMLQLSQAMAAGKLQGDEFRSIMENAPMIAQAIADYTGKSKGELKEMGSEGTITADIIKNSMFAMSDEINSKFATMPVTFGDIWNKIKNGGLKAFNSVMTKTSELINTSQFQSFVDNMVNGFYIIAGAANIALDIISGIGSFISSNWGIIEPILWGVIAALIVYNAMSGIAYFKTLQQIGAKMAKVAVDWLEYAAIFALTVAQQGLNAALAACPITWIIIAVIALIVLFYAAIGVINKLAGTSISATGIIAGVFMACLAFIGNLFVTLINLIIDIIGVVWDFIATFAEFFANVFVDPIGSIIRLFAGLADTVLGILEGIASAIDTIFGSNLANAVSGWRDSLQVKVDDLVGEPKIKIERMDTSQYKLDRFNYGDAYNAGYNWGANLSDKFNLGSLLNGLGDNGINGALGSDFGTSSNPLAVEGTGKDGAVDVDMADEDLQYLRDIAEREYINKFSTATLAPNIQITFGDVHEEADADKVAGRIKKILQEEIATASEGEY